MMPKAKQLLTFTAHTRAQYTADAQNVWSMHVRAFLECRHSNYQGVLAGGESKEHEVRIFCREVPLECSFNETDSHHGESI